jgi:hypothetical protein
VPEIYVQVTTTADGDETTVVVDGQQRITTCIRFVMGELRLSMDKELDIRWRGRTFAELDDGLKKRFRSFALIVRSMPEIGEIGLREIFRRLNETVEALEAQELRHAAYTGPFIQLTEQIAAHSALNDVGVFSAKDYLRRRSDEFASEVLYAIYLNAFPNKKEGLDDLFKTFEWSEKASTSLTTLERRMGRAIEQISSIAPVLRRTRFRNKSDFYSLLVFLARHAESLPIAKSREPEFVDTIKRFSSLVNETKRVEGLEGKEETTTLGGAPAEVSPFDRAAVKYLRAVERAASDRLNRVRRNDALTEVLSGLVMAGRPRPLTEADSAALAESKSDDEGSEVDGNDTVESRVQAQRALIEMQSSPSLRLASTNDGSSVDQA